MSVVHEFRNDARKISFDSETKGRAEKSFNFQCSSVYFDKRKALLSLHFIRPFNERTHKTHSTVRISPLLNLGLWIWTLDKQLLQITNLQHTHLLCINFYSCSKSKSKSNNSSSEWARRVFLDFAEVEKSLNICKYVFSNSVWELNFYRHWNPFQKKIYTYMPLSSQEMKKKTYIFEISMEYSVNFKIFISFSGDWAIRPLRISGIRAYSKYEYTKSTERHNLTFVSQSWSVVSLYTKRYIISKSVYFCQ